MADEFLEACKNQSDFIRQGGLKERSPRAEQVHSSSWEWLAKINERGLLTINSQDSIYPITGEVKDYERSYVAGYMPIDKVMSFVDRFNLANEDKIAMVGIPIEPELIKYYRNKTGINGTTIAVTRRIDQETGNYFRSNSMPGYADPRGIRLYKASWKIPEDFEMIGVDIFDTKWGRAATSKKGLFRAVIKGLDSTVVHTKPSKGRWA